MINFIFEQSIPNRTVTYCIFCKGITTLFSLYILLFASSGLAFETNVNSKITADLEVTGTLKVGSLADSTGLVTSTETFETNDNDVTVPTTKAVKAYVDSATASSSSGTAVPSNIVYSGSFSRTSDNEFFTAESGLLTGMKWVASDNQFMINSSLYNPIPVIELLHSDGNSSTTAAFSVTRRASYLTYPPDGYQYLTGGGTKNSDLDMDVGNVLRVTLLEWGATDYFYEIIATRSSGKVNVIIRKGGAL